MFLLKLKKSHVILTSQLKLLFNLFKILLKRGFHENVMCRKRLRCQRTETCPASIDDQKDIPAYCITREDLKTT